MGFPAVTLIKISAGTFVKGTSMDPRAPNFGKRFESSDILTETAISVAPYVSLSIRFLINILIRHCLMLDPMNLGGEKCL